MLLHLLSFALKVQWLNNNSTERGQHCCFCLFCSCSITLCPVPLRFHCERKKTLRCPLSLSFRHLPCFPKVPWWPGDVGHPGRSPEGQPYQAGAAGLCPGRADCWLPRSCEAGSGPDEAVPAHRPASPQAGSPRQQDPAQGHQLAPGPGEVRDSWGSSQG